MPGALGKATYGSKAWLASNKRKSLQNDALTILKVMHSHDSYSESGEKTLEEPLRKQVGKRRKGTPFMFMSSYQWIE